MGPRFVTLFLVLSHFFKVNGKTKQELQEDLLFAAEMGHLEDLEKLISLGTVDLEMAWAPNTPLLMAATHNRTKVVERLLQAGVDVDVQARDGTRPITTASYHGHIEVLKILIKAGTNLKFNDAASGISPPLVTAATNNQIATIRLLVDAGMDVDIRTHSADTALMLASLEGKMEAVEELIKLGATIDVLNQQGNTPLLAAAFKGKCEIVDILIKNGANPFHRNHDTQTPLLVAATGGYSRCIRFLAKAGVDVNQKDRLNNTAISMAARSNHIEAVRVLIEAGIDVNALDDMRMTALHHALAHNHQQTVKILALAGASFGPSKDHEGIDKNNIPKIEVCDWFRAILIAHKLPTKQQSGHRNLKPMKACEWMKHLGFSGSIVDVLDQVQLFGYAAIVRLFRLDLFSRGETDAMNVDAAIRKAYLDIKDLHSKEYRVAYRFSDEDVIEDELPGLLKNTFGMNITLPEKPKDDDDKKTAEPEEILPEIHRPPPEERPEFAKAKPGEEELEEELERFRREQEELAAQNHTVDGVVSGEQTQKQLQQERQNDEDSLAAEL